MRKWLALLFACLALGLVVAGCGGDDDDDGGGGGASTTAPADGDEPAESGQRRRRRRRQVGMKNIQFEPEDVTVKAGEPSPGPTTSPCLTT